MKNKTYKLYFILINIIGYFIFVFSSVAFYSAPLREKDFRWIISALIGSFIVIFKNSKTSEKIFSSIFYFVDTSFIIFLSLYFKFTSYNNKFTFLMSLLFLSLNILAYCNLVLSEKISFKEEVYDSY